MAKPKKWYAVVRGREPGLYETWFGPEGAEAQVRGFTGALYRGFSSRAEAQAWLRSPVGVQNPAGRRCSPGLRTVPCTAPARLGEVVAYTDGSCLRNPGPGGYGAILIVGDKRREWSRGFRWTTNNRMELMAALGALSALSAPSDVVLHSDSRYLVQGVEKGWARRWRASGWLRAGGRPAENADLWARLLDLCDRHRVRFSWVRGHAGHPENERCDQLAVAAARGEVLDEDEAYVRGGTTVPAKPEGARTSG